MASGGAHCRHRPRAGSRPGLTWLPASLANQSSMNSCCHCFDLVRRCQLRSHRRARPASSSPSSVASSCASSGCGWSIRISMPIALAPILSMLANARARMARSSGERLPVAAQRILRVGDQDDALVLADRLLRRPTIARGDRTSARSASVAIGMVAAVRRSARGNGSGLEIDADRRFPAEAGEQDCPDDDQRGGEQAGERDAAQLAARRLRRSAAPRRQAGRGPSPSGGAAGPRSAAFALKIAHRLDPRRLRAANHAARSD